MISVETGVVSDGLSTSVLPAASAGAHFRLLDFELAGNAAPVFGCFDNTKNPLVSLDAAVASLHQPDLATFVYQAKAWVRRDATKLEIRRVPDLTADGAMAIWLYTAESPLYTRLNESLRSLDRAFRPTPPG